MQTVLHSDLVSVSAALERLGLTEEVLLEAARQGHLARANTTANHPPLHGPFVSWSEPVRALRDGLVTSGWKRNNDNHWPRVIHPNGHIALTVATGNEATGRTGESPITKSPKGPRTLAAVEVNRGQLWLPGMEPQEPEPGAPNRDEPSTWLLLIHYAKDEVRCELSLPMGVDSDDRVSVWRERIILRPLPLDLETIDITPPQQPDIDVTVRRKA